MNSWHISEGTEARIQRVDRPPPRPAPHQVLIKVRSASVNYRDLILSSGTSGLKNLNDRTALSDGAGEVVEVGSAVTLHRKGDRVAGCFFQSWHEGPFDMCHHASSLGGGLDGMLAEWVVLNESGVVSIPDHLSYEEAACLPCAALTAWSALVERGHLAPGQTVLLQGTGGVSIFALQIANAMGARVIITSSSDAKLQRARDLGAWETINYKSFPNWDKEVWRLTAKRGVDHVVEVGGQATFERSLNCLAAGGHIALIGVLTGIGAPTCGLFPLVTKNARINGIYVGSRNSFLNLNRFLIQHHLHPVIDERFDFDDAPSALSHLAAANHFGKVVINL